MIITEDANDSGGKKDSLKDLLKLIVFGILCVLPFLQERAAYQLSVEQEIVDNQGMMTLEGYRTAKGVAGGIYNFVMTDLGLYNFLYVSLKNTQVPRDSFEKFWSKFLLVSDRIVDNLPLMIYQMGWRLGVAAYWIVYFIPFFLACIYSGTQHWKLSLEQTAGATAIQALPGSIKNHHLCVPLVPGGAYGGRCVYDEIPGPIRAHAVRHHDQQDDCQLSQIGVMTEI